MPAIDEFSVSTVPVEMFFNDTFLSVATAFVWEYDGRYFIITNWHNVSGRNPFTGNHLSKTLAEPNRIKIWWNVKEQLGSKQASLHPLMGERDQPLWMVHPHFQHGIDVIALSIEPPEYAEPFPINRMPSEDIQIRIGMDVFILGYPFGVSAGGLPVWKRASVASEPELALPSRRNHFWVDTASRPGMSGSPVIRRTWGGYQDSQGAMNIHPSDATRLIGIYSGRIGADNELQAQLGIVWPMEFIPQIVQEGLREEAS